MLNTTLLPLISQISVNKNSIAYCEKGNHKLIEFSNKQETRAFLASLLKRSES